MAQIGPRLARKKSRGQQALVPIKEAGTMLGIGRLTTYRLNKDGQLSIRQIGRRTLIPTVEVQIILDHHCASE